MIELVEPAPFLPPGGQGRRPAVGREEGGRKAAKEVRHAKVAFPVAVMDRRVKRRAGRRRSRRCRARGRRGAVWGRGMSRQEFRKAGQQLAAGSGHAAMVWAAARRNWAPDAAPRKLGPPSDGAFSWGVAPMKLSRRQPKRGPRSRAAGPGRRPEPGRRRHFPGAAIPGPGKRDGRQRRKPALPGCGIRPLRPGRRVRRLRQPDGRRPGRP